MNKEDYNEYYIQGSDHYLIPRDIFEELFDEMSNWREEAKELKKQVEKTEECLKDMYHINIENDKELEKAETQQKEFIDYLENEKDRLIKECSYHYTDSFDRQHAVNEDMYDEVDKISIKYKEIIGGNKDE